MSIDCTMASSLSNGRPPYLALTISQVLSLPAPAASEPRQHDSVNSMLDLRALHMPNRLAVGFTYRASYGVWKCHTLTYAQVRTLSLAIARELAARLPERGSKAESFNGTPLVAVLSPSGADLFGHIIALWRLGYGVLCIAPGTPGTSIANLLLLTDTRLVLAHASQLKAAQAALETANKNKHVVLRAQVCQMLPDVIYLANGDGINAKGLHHQPSHEGRAGPEDVLVTMHTSGSSGLPKPIHQLHRFWTASMLSAAGRDLTAFTTTPLFHGGMSDLLRSIQAGSSIFFHPTADSGALSTSAICQAITACPPISYFLSVPYILDMLFTDPEDGGRRMLASMELVSTGGAPLSQQLGDKMVQQEIKLVSRLGSSECGFLMSSWRDFKRDKAWDYLRIPDELGQSMIRFEPYDALTKEVLYELVVTKAWPTKLVANRNDGSYATSDLYCKHKSLPNAWKYHSRSDDTIVLVSGKKATTSLAEQKLKSSGLVSEAIVFGANKAILGALVFVSPQAVHEWLGFHDEVKVKLLKQLQPVLAEVNAASPPHAQLAIEMVHLLPPSQAASIPRASKGTLQRGRAYQQYAELIESIYAKFEEGRSLRLDHASNSKRALTGAELITWLEKKVKDINGSDVSPGTDLFVAGVDSIQSARIRAAIHQNIDLGGKLLIHNVVYEYPTTKLLAQHIETVRTGGERKVTTDERQRQELELMRQLVNKYSTRHVKVPYNIKPPFPSIKDYTMWPEEYGCKDTFCILTGVTGGLGAQVLAHVLEYYPSADTIVCLVRAKSKEHARERVLDSLRSRQLEEAFALVQSEDSRVQCLPADLSRPDGGVLLRSLALQIKHLKVLTIHAAWSVNFVARLSSFEHSDIAGLAQLIDLHESLVKLCWFPNDSYFVFCSSVASILGSDVAKRGGDLEEVLSNEPADAVEMGYARSKWVAEQIVARRAQRAPDEAKADKSKFISVRIGQLCSDTRHGVWNQNEAWPILIQLSQQIGCFPFLKYQRMDWNCIDTVAQKVVDLAARYGVDSGVYHLASPVTDPYTSELPYWEDLYRWLVKSGLKLEPVSPERWLELIQVSGCDHRGLLSLWQKNLADSRSATTRDRRGPRFCYTKTRLLLCAFHDSIGYDLNQNLIQKTVQRWQSIGFLK